jgi:hypothetical protein
VGIFPRYKNSKCPRTHINILMLLSIQIKSLKIISISIVPVLVKYNNFKTFFSLALSVQIMNDGLYSG